MVRGKTFANYSKQVERSNTKYYLDDPVDEDEEILKTQVYKHSESKLQMLSDPVRDLKPEKDRFSFYLYYLKTKMWMSYLILIDEVLRKSHTLYYIPSSACWYRNCLNRVNLRSPAYSWSSIKLSVWFGFISFEILSYGSNSSYYELLRIFYAKFTPNDCLGLPGAAKLSLSNILTVFYC